MFTHKTFLILVAMLAPGQVKAQEASALGPAGGIGQGFVPLASAEAKAAAAEAGPPKVRMGLRLTPFHRVVTKRPDGTSETRFVLGEPQRHTLRARLNQSNHFFVGEWHVETVPTRWIRKTQRYEVKLNLFRRYGAFGQLEENVGSIELAGTLQEQPDHVFVLLGVAKQRLRDKSGNPYLDVVAGFAAPNGKDNTALSLKESTPEKATPFNLPTAPATPPADYSGDLIRGRF